MSWRRIVVDRKEFFYQIGTSNLVILGHGYHSLDTVIGCSWDEFERGQRKKYCMVRPAHVADFIKRKFLT